MTNTFGYPIPTAYVVHGVDAFYVNIGGGLGSAPVNTDGTVDWDGMDDAWDLSDVTPADMDRIAHDLGLDAWPSMAVLPGESFSPEI